MGCSPFGGGDGRFAASAAFALHLGDRLVPAPESDPERPAYCGAAKPSSTVISSGYMVFLWKSPTARVRMVGNVASPACRMARASEREDVIETSRLRLVQPTG